MIEKRTLIDADKIQLRRLRLSTPFIAHEILEAGFHVVKSRRGARCWALAPTSFTDDVEHYYERSRILASNSPRPRMRSKLESAHSAEIALKIQSALRFAELGAMSDPLVRPILLYYSCAHLIGAMTRSYFEWDCDSRTHGINHVIKVPIDKTEIRLPESGQFRRLAVYCFLMSGYPTRFSPVVVYREKPAVHRGPGEPLERFGLEEMGFSTVSLSLGQLKKWDGDFYVKDVCLRFGLHKNKCEPSTLLLLDVLGLFVASSIARYDIAGWNEIIAGKTTDLRVYFERLQERYLSGMMDLMLAAIENPFMDFGQELQFSRPSLYDSGDSSLR